MRANVFPQHSSELLEYLHKLYQENKLCDIVIHTNDGKAFPSHRIVWGFASAYLHQLFLDNYNVSTVHLDLPSDVSQTLLEFCYTGKLQASEQTLPEIKQAATFLQMHKVVERLNSSCNEQDVDNVTESSVECEVQETSKGSIKLNKKLEQDDFIRSQNDDEDDDISSLQYLKEDSPDVVHKNKRMSPTKSTKNSIKKTPRKTSKKVNSSVNVECEKEPTNRSSMTEENVQNTPVRKSARKRKPKLTEDYSFVELRTKHSKTTIETNLKQKTPRKIEPVKNKKLDKVPPSKSKKTTEGKKRQKTISKVKETKNKVTGKEKGPWVVSRSIVSKSQTPKTLNSDSSNRIYIPKGRSVWCDDCEISFTSYHKLRRHKLKHHTFNIIQLLCGQYILKRCLNAKHKLSNKISGKFISKKISSKLGIHSGVRNNLKLSRRVSFTGLMKYLAANLKQYKALETQIKKRDSTSVSTESAARVLSPAKIIKKGNSEPEGAYVCPLCKKQMTAQYSIFKHLQIVHHIAVEEARTLQFVLPEPLVCEAYGCDYSNSNLQEMKDHMKNEHPSIKLLCTHLKCQSTFPLNILLERHMNERHKPGRSRYFECDLCKMRFPRGQALRRHKFFKHDIQMPGLKVLYCSNSSCDFKTLSAHALNLHKSKHTTEKPFTCETCGMKLKTEVSHKKHMQKMHLGIRPYLCQICGMRFGEVSELKAHTLCRHSGEKNYQCEYCPYSTSNKVTFHTHIFRVHKVRSAEDKRELFKCPHCPFTSILGHIYRIHLNGHEGKRDYKCKLCDMWFISSACRYAHMQWKHLDKYKSCSQCGYQTKTQNKLNEHIRVQHQLKGVFPYRCPYCSFKCATGGNTRKHVKQVHKNMEVRYIRDDDILAAAREARESGNLSVITESDQITNEEVKESLESDADNILVTESIEPGVDNILVTESFKPDMDNILLTESFKPGVNEILVTEDQVLQIIC